MPVHTPRAPLAHGLGKTRIMPAKTLLNLWTQASELLHASRKPKVRRRPQITPTTPSLLIFPEQDSLPALPFLLIRDSFRTMRITVRRDGTVQVKTPFFTKDTEVLRAIGQKRAWIESKRQEFQQRPAQPTHNYRNGDVFYYVGRPFTLLLREMVPLVRAKLPTVRMQGHNLIVIGDNLTPERVQKAIAAWRNAVSHALFTKRFPRVHRWMCDVMGDDIPLPEWKLRSLKRRWASCARRRSRTLAHGSVTHHEVTLARHLSAVPLKCIDYVIAHELCHMRYMDHSPRFYALLNSLLPNAPQLSRQLDAWGVAHGRD